MLKSKVRVIKQKRYGWRPSRPNINVPRFLRVTNSADLPPMVDLSTSASMPPIYDQGQLGSCTANAGAGLAEFLLRKFNLADFMPSRLFIYYNERVIDGDVPQDAGASLSDAIQVMTTDGVPPEVMWPYDITQFATDPPQPVYDAGKLALMGPGQQVNQDDTDLKGVLASGYPVIFGFTVYESFESQEVASTGIVPMPGPDEQILGGHAVMIVGYDSTDTTEPTKWKVRNSWGSGWGLSGYFIMPDAYILNPNLASDFWTAQSIA